jgi:hypothetical protein
MTTLALLKDLLLKGVTQFTRVGETFPRAIEEATDAELWTVANIGRFIKDNPPSHPVPCPCPLCVTFNVNQGGDVGVSPSVREERSAHQDGSTPTGNP